MKLSEILKSGSLSKEGIDHIHNQEKIIKELEKQLENSFAYEYTTSRYEEWNGNSLNLKHPKHYQNILKHRLKAQHHISFQC